ncbi:MAG TPA: pentapeptide repeat-containing protein, partial [Pseudonocardiaceae bacterium]|nr:pentapeptide repeat-containing protein [Pseudonocardiaceae bacterium]
VAAALSLLWWRYGGGAEVRLKLDLIRTAGGVMVVTGGALTLLLAARRQQSAELTLEHQREVAAATERDADEQRITELYTHAVNQLGAEKAPVRLGGLHALERLAQNNPIQRQTIVDVICAYLRMPFTPPDGQAPGEDASRGAHHRYEQRRQELQVRLTAQRILTAHLKPAVAAAFWADIDLNLTEAHLYQLDLTHCRVRTAKFDGAQFSGNAEFGGATFAGDAVFNGAKFTAHAMFGETTFAGDAWFFRAEFAGDVWQIGTTFDGATFVGIVVFGNAEFDNSAWFGGATFAGDAAFGGVTFAGDAWFVKAEFARDADFDSATFVGDAAFDSATFAADPRFDGARARRSSLVILPTGWTTRVARTSEGEDEGWLNVVRVEDRGEQRAEAPSHEEDLK